MGDSLNKFGRWVFWALVGVGVFFVGRDVWEWSGIGAAAVVQVQAAGKGPAMDQPAAGCLCSAGAECVGPRGGKYCLGDDGKKRYKGQQ